MPKKFAGENSKAVSAKERKAQKAAEERSQKEQAADAAKWMDDDKNLAKKQMRKVSTYDYLNLFIRRYLFLKVLHFFFT